MQFAVIVAVSAHLGSILLVGWMTVQLHRHMRRIDQRLASLEREPARVSVAVWPEPAAVSHALQPAPPPGSNEPVPLRRRTRTMHKSGREQAESLPR